MLRRHELWVAESDPMFSLLLDDNGGASLFELGEARAVEVFTEWWRQHGARYRAWQRVQARRTALRLVPAVPECDPTEQASRGEA